MNPNKPDADKAAELDQWINDEFDQAVKRGGKQYAEAYCDGLNDGYNHAQSYQSGKERAALEKIARTSTTKEYCHELARQALSGKQEDQDELVPAQIEYIKLLDAAYNDAYGIAYVHGYREPQERISKGLELRLKIDSLNRKYGYKV